MRGYGTPTPARLSIILFVCSRHSTLVCFAVLSKVDSRKPEENTLVRINVIDDMLNDMTTRLKAGMKGH